jgi:predicted transcriptional regulator
MTKKPFTTRLDEQVLELAHRLAKADRRSVTTIIELAVLEYADRRGVKPASVAEDQNA